MAEIKSYTGTPTLFLDGRPAFNGLMWGSAPLPDSYALQDRAPAYAKAGIHLFTFDIGTTGQPPEWVGPGSDRDGHFDFSTLPDRFQHVLDADPEARFHLRVHLEMPLWWQDLYPVERELLSDGRSMAQSFASTVWRAQAKDFLRALVAHLKAVGLFERVIAYPAGAGDTGEWVKGGGAMSTACGDFSPPMQEHFRSWLRQRYQDSESALQRAWNQSAITFARGRCRPGFGVKVFPDWTSIYVAAPNLPAPVLRGLARYAGVHLYNEQGDVLYATPDLLAVHTLAGGERTFSLPRPVEVVYDLFERQTLAEAANHFQVTLPPASTALYYIGDVTRLKQRAG